MDKTVVLIQDNQHILEVMDEILTDEGFDVISSVTTEPIDKLPTLDPDLIIIDDHIKGGKRGSKVISELKSDPATEDVPAVLTSTSQNVGKEAQECLADDYIEKPFEIEQMISVAKKNS
ncbi:hypothetical protein ASG01_13700 [Chryseobacterium sp. Leaf180]|uniref:response regulator n=1 Tax=Chryseobacterium sp. Leaf180 TaxID=1736289 RepID=UPI0006FB8465|nr:response regulator [Chryseobacterium sp. Leaf180]KQR91424.1 hypothetical protein ASG01_13700 [Chryseobacterium sp. Leaf180]